MSSQADRIKAFKLQQHARLQKQNEEEHWISGEELCTEGSSDEETYTSSDVKPSQRMRKRNLHTEKRGISPLAQPPKILDEVTTTYLQDSRYLLPDPQALQHTVSGKNELKIAKSIGNINLDTSANKPSGSNEVSNVIFNVSHQSEETVDNKVLEAECSIQWRPKRGSIKLPDLSEDVEDDSFEIASLLSLEKNRNDNLLFKDLVDRICELDSQIIDNEALFQKQTEKRKCVENEMCILVCNSDVSSSHSKSSQLFLQLCNFEDAKSERDTHDHIENGKNKSDNQAKVKKKKNRSSKDFITRNIELARQNIHMYSSLTDEEKCHLESLLEGIDKEDLGENETTDESKVEGSYKTFPKATKEDNAFKIKAEELTIMEDLEKKIQELNKLDADEMDNLPNINTPADELEVADKEGRYWKHFKVHQRLQDIEKNLALIASKDHEEKQRLEEQNLKVSILREAVNDKDCEETCRNKEAENEKS